MTSKNLYFKLMKEDLKRRLWTVTLISLACFFAYPVTAAFLAGNIEKDTLVYHRNGLLIYTENLQSFLSFDSGITAFGMVVASLICGLSSFSYLNSRSKVDFYHGLPIRRERLFAANYVSGILYLAVPYGISMILAVLVGTANGVSGSVLWPMALEGYFLHLVYYVLMYTITVIAAVMTGNLVIGFLGTMVFDYFVPLSAALIHGYFTTFYATYTYLSGEASFLFRWGLRMSPILEYFHQITQYRTINTYHSMIGPALGALAVSLFLAVVGGVLYKHRPSEAAGKAMAFAISKPIIRNLLTLVSGLGLGAFFWAIRSSMGWAVFGILCGTVICHCVVEIIYHFDFKKLFANKLQLVGCILMALAVFCVFRYDMTGYDSWLPSQDKVKEASVILGRLNGWVSYGRFDQNKAGEWEWQDQDSSAYVFENMHYKDVENLLAIAQEGIRQVNADKEDRLKQDLTAREVSVIGGADGPTAVFVAGVVGRDEDPEEADIENWSEVVIRYTLANGRNVYRKYHLCLEAVLPQVERLMADEQYQKGNFPLMNRIGEEVSSIRYRDGEETIWLEDLTREEKAELLAAYQQEFSALTLSQMYWQAPVGLIRFTSQEEDQGLKWMEEQENEDYISVSYDSGSSRRYRYRRYGVWNRDYYPVYPSFTRTLALLKEHEIDSGAYFRRQEVASIQIRQDVYDEEEQWLDTLEAVFTKPEEIQELMEVLEDRSRLYYNPCYQSEPDYQVSLSVVKSRGDYAGDVIFPLGRVPEFVKERLREETE